MREGIRRKKEWRGPERGWSWKVLIEREQMSPLRERREAVEKEPLLILLTGKFVLNAKKQAWCGSGAIDGCG
jgi:hypothetical protein